jgi:hypothetical protein
MVTAKELAWRDVEMGAPAESGVWARPRHEPFPLVRRIHEPDDDVHALAFFAAPPLAIETFEDLVDEVAQRTWHERRYRRAAVKILAALAFGAFAGLSAVTATENAHARSAVTEWATMGVAR